MMTLKDFIKTKPRLYDLARRVYPARSSAAMFFNQFSRVRNGQVNFIQVGANDGLRSDPIRPFIVRDKWRGVLVEPLPSVFSTLVQNYRYIRGAELVFVNAAVGPSSGENLSFWTYSDEFLAGRSLESRLKYLRLSSFNKEHVLKELGPYPHPEALVREIAVPCLTLNDLAARYWRGRRSICS